MAKNRFSHNVAFKWILVTKYMTTNTNAVILIDGDAGMANKRAAFNTQSASRQVQLHKMGDHFIVTVVDSNN